MPNRTELSFSFQEKDLARLRGLPAIKALGTGRAYTRQLEDVYFDTPERALRQQSLTFCVAKNGRRYTQCATLGDRQFDGGLPPASWEGQVPTEDPVLPAIRNDGIRRSVAAVGAERLAPVFRVESKRTSRRLAFDGGVEAALHIDVGEIVTATGRQPVLELLLVSEPGASHQLFDLVREIQAQVPLRPVRMSRAERGFGLLTGEPPAWVKDTKVVLSPDATVEETLIQVVRHSLNHMIANEACVLHDDHPEGVHQMRVALRRLRSGLRLFQSVLPPDQYGWAVEEIRWLAGELGPTRDWDVFRDEIVAPVAAHRPDDAAFGAFLARIDGERDRCRHASRQAVASPRYTALVLGLAHWLARRGWRDQPLTETAANLFGPITALSSVLMSKRHKKVRKGGRRFAVMSIDERHQLRIEVKKVRYAGHFFASLYPPKRVAPYAERLARLQEALGYLNDVSVAEILVERLCAACTGEEALRCRQAGGMVVGWHTRALVEAEDTLCKEVTRFIKGKPFWSDGESGSR